MIKVFLLVGAICYSHCYTLQCPEVSQRKLRSHSLCPYSTNREYYCLFDANHLGYVEHCMEKPDFIRPGYKLIIRGSRDGTPCDKKFYQPFKFWTNVTSNCLIRKSECTEEGQITYRNGSSISDTTCRCDYTKGYSFVTTPKDICFCIPSSEDCSCHQKPCQSNQYLTPDYQCMQSSDQFDFHCPYIQKSSWDNVKPRLTPRPSLPTYTFFPDASMIYELSLFKRGITVLIFAGFVVIAIGLLCRAASCGLFISRKTSLNLKNIDVPQKGIQQTKTKTKTDENNDNLSPTYCTEDGYFARSMTDPIEGTTDKDFHSWFKYNFFSYCENNENKDSEIFDMLEKKNLDINELDEYGRSPLIIACYLDRPVLAQRLLKGDADTSIIDQKNHSALLVASKRGNDEIVKALLLKNKNADKSKTDLDGTLNMCNTPLLAACEGGHSGSVVLLLKYGANVNKCDQEGLSPLVCACLKRKENIVKLLMDAHANTETSDPDGRTPLLIACKEGCYKAVEILLSSGADIGKYDDNDQTSLFIACECGHPKTVTTILKHTPCTLDLINQCDNMKKSPLYIACQKNRFEIVRILLSKGADALKCDISRRSPFYVACRNGYLDIVQYLHEHGSDILFCNNRKGSPLLAACREGHTDVVEFLVEHITSAGLIKADSNGMTPLLIACENLKTDTAVLLIKRNAGINECNNNRNCPLHVAVLTGNMEIVEALVDNRADKYKKNNDGLTPLDIAKNRGFREIQNIL